MYDVVLVGTNNQEQEYNSERTCISHLEGPQLPGLSVSRAMQRGS